jgi:hypothetical protein
MAKLKDRKGVTGQEEEEALRLGEREKVEEGRCSSTPEVYERRRFAVEGRGLTGGAPRRRDRGLGDGEG